jgi:hypothetical protein
MSRPQQDAYLMGALEWLRDRHGAENVFYAGGIERSRARHVSIREFYSRINAPTPGLDRAADLPQPKVLETKRQYGERVYGHVRDTVGPVLRSVRLTQAELAARDAQGFRRAAEESRQAVSSARLDVEVQRRHGEQKLERAETQLRDVLELVLRGGPPLEQRRQAMLAALGREVENRSRGPGRGVDHDEPDLDRGPKLNM